MSSEHSNLEARALELFDRRLCQDDGMLTSEEIARSVLRDLAGDDAQLRKRLAAAIIAFDRELSGDGVGSLDLR